MLNRRLSNRKILSYIQLTLGIFFGVVTFIIPLIFSNPRSQAVFGIVATIIIFYLTFKINNLILMPMNKSAFAKKIYNFYAKHPNEMSPTTVRFIEDLNHTESQIIETGLSYIFLRTSPEASYDCTWSRKVEQSKALLLFIPNNQEPMGSCLDNNYEVKKLMDLGILNYSPVPLPIREEFNPLTPLLLYRNKNLIKITPTSAPMRFDCYEASYRAIEILLALDHNAFNQKALVTLAAKLKGSAFVDQSVQTLEKNDGGFGSPELAEFKRVE